MLLFTDTRPVLSDATFPQTLFIGNRVNNTTYGQIPYFSYAMTYSLEVPVSTAINPNSTTYTTTFLPFSRGFFTFFEKALDEAILDAYYPDNKADNVEDDPGDEIEQEGQNSINVAVFEDLSPERKQSGKSTNTTLRYIATERRADAINVQVSVDGSIYAEDNFASPHPFSFDLLPEISQQIDHIEVLEGEIHEAASMIPLQENSAQNVTSFEVQGVQDSLAVVETKEDQTAVTEAEKTFKQEFNLFGAIQITLLASNPHPFPATVK
jgi:hypothetical protein